MVENFGSNPLAVLTFIVAPAVLTNAASVMGMQTATRFARAIDRARLLSEQLRGKEQGDDPEIKLRLRQIEFAERRALLLVRALTGFYLSVGSLAGASFTSLLGAIFFIFQLQILRDVALTIALGCGVLGIGGLLVGLAILVWEARQSLAILSAETEFVRRSRTERLLGGGKVHKQTEV